MNEVDVAIVGSSFSALSAAQLLVNSLREVAIFGAKKLNGARAHLSHNFLGYEGRDPQSLINIAHKTLLRYPNTHFHASEVIDIQ